MARSFTRIAVVVLVFAMVSASTAGIPPMASTAAAKQQPSASHRFTGLVSIERRPAPEGTLVRAMIGNRQCGSGRTDREGRYLLDVVSETTATGCGRAGARVQFAVLPRFGDGWRLVRTVAFQSGAQTDHAIDVDLRELPGDVNNVPWIGIIWPDVRRVPVGICEEVDSEIAEAIDGALEQYRAALDYGLLTELVFDHDRACEVGGDPGISIIAGDLRDRSAIAYTIPLDADLDPIRCDAVAPCEIGKVAVLINSSTLLRLDHVERSNVIAHEIGHALGMAHALRCTGGTIMWADTECRHPLSHLGSDDIAALNAILSLGLVQQQGEEPLRKAGGNRSASTDRHVTRSFASLHLRADMLAEFAFHRHLANERQGTAAGSGLRLPAILAGTVAGLPTSSARRRGQELTA